MSLSKVLAVLDGTPPGEHALATALQFGREFACRVEVLHVEVDPESSIPILGDGMSGAVVTQMIDSMRESSQARREQASRMFDDQCVRTGLPVVEPSEPLKNDCFNVSFTHVVGIEADEVSRRGGLADVTVLARPSADSDLDLSATLDAALFDTGRPVLLVSAAPPEQILGTVAIAWDGSKEACRAVATTLPILKRAERIIVLTAREATVKSEPSDLTNFLAGHGLEAKTWAFIPSEEPVGKCLLAEVAKADATMLVMGGYGHSRFREMILGGVTRSVLNEAELPVLLVH